MWLLLAVATVAFDEIIFKKSRINNTSTYYIRKKKYFNHNLGGGGNFTISPPHSFWFSLNNSEMVKAITLWHFIRDIHAKFGISNSPQSLDIGQNSDGGISNFWISGQCLIKEKS